MDLFIIKVKIKINSKQLMLLEIVDYLKFSCLIFMSTDLLNSTVVRSISSADLSVSELI